MSFKVSIIIMCICTTLISCKNEDSPLGADGATKDQSKPNSSEETSDNAPLVVNSTSANGREDTESIITLSYTDSDGDLATNCAVSNLSNITASTPCSCDGSGVCTVGVTGTRGYFGAASFDYTVTANSQVSNTATLSYTIDSVSISCPTGFVAVDGNGLLGTNDFCVMKYEAKCASDCNNLTDLPVSQATRTPWVNIDADQAQARCEAMSEEGFRGTFSLISNPEWMTIARDIENTAINWSSGSIGEGHIPRGHSDLSPYNALAVTDTLDPYDGTENNSGQAAGEGWEQKRTHTLSNESEIWDLAGNVQEWTDWDSDSSGFTVGPKDEIQERFELSINPTGSLLLDDYKPNNDSYDSTNNSFGVWYGGPHGAALRGGMWANLSNAGVFTLNLTTPPFISDQQFGFRCTYRP